MPDTTSNNKRIAKNTLLLYFRTLFIMAVTLYTSRVVLNTLGVTDYGIYGAKYIDDLKHIMHLRNSISHGKVEFDDANRENVICIFKDDGGSGKYEYQLKLSVHNVEPLIQELCLAQQSYINDLIARDKKEKVSD